MLSADQKEALGVALNEATLVGVDFDEAAQLAQVSFAAFSIGEDGAATTAHVKLVLQRVGRIAVSLREGRWDDRLASVTVLTLSELPSVVRAFGGLPVYGWDFIDTGELEMSRWGDRLSLDWRSREADAPSAHSLVLFQDGQTRHLDLCIWFEALGVEDLLGREVSLSAFTESGRRWWEAFRENDPRTQGSGMFPLK